MTTSIQTKQCSASAQPFYKAASAEIDKQTKGTDLRKAAFGQLIPDGYFRPNPKSSHLKYKSYCLTWNAPTKVQTAFETKMNGARVQLSNMKMDLAEALAAKAEKAAEAEKAAATKAVKTEVFEQAALAGQQYTLYFQAKNKQRALGKVVAREAAKVGFKKNASFKERVSAFIGGVYTGTKTRISNAWKRVKVALANAWKGFKNVPSRFSAGLTSARKLASRATSYVLSFVRKDPVMVKQGELGQATSKEAAAKTEKADKQPKVEEAKTEKADKQPKVEEAKTEKADKQPKVEEAKTAKAAAQ